MDAKTAIMKARSRQLRLQLAALNNLKMLFVREIQSLVGKAVSKRQAIGGAQREPTSYGTACPKKLSVNARKFLLQRTAIELKGRLLDLETVSLRVKREIRKSEQQTADLQEAKKRIYRRGARRPLVGH